MLSGIISHSMKLHLGVYCVRRALEPGASTHPWKNALSDGTILLSDMVDALGSVFHLLVEFVRSLREVAGSNQTPVVNSISKASKHGKDAIEHLDKARDQLVRELHGRDTTDMVGPVVTPEAITITLMQRLASGVFCEGTVDVISLYEECLEHLVRRLCASLKYPTDVAR